MVLEPHPQRVLHRDVVAVGAAAANLAVGAVFVQNAALLEAGRYYCLAMQGVIAGEISTASTAFTRRQWVALVVLAFTGPIALSAIQGGFIYDDPFILLRYAKHLAEGVGWEFNPTLDTENAVTAPLWVLLLAVGGGTWLWSALLYTAAWGFGGMLLARVLIRDGNQAAGWIGCGLYSISALLANVRGMETSLYLLLILATIWAVQGHRWLLTGALLGLLAMTRTDAVAIGGAVLVWVLWRHRQHLLRVAAPFFSITAAWTLLLWWITGDPFPTTLAAKLAQRHTEAGVGEWSWLLNLTHATMGGSDAKADQIIILGWVGMIMIALAVAGTITARHQTALPLLAACAFVVLVEYGLVLRMSAAYIWHYAPITLWLIASAAVGAVRSRILTATLVLTGIVGTVVGFRFDPIDIRSNYQAAAEWIGRDSAESHPTVAVAEIGTIGYRSRVDIIDYMGLLDHRAIDFVERGDFTWWVTQRPDYWVSAWPFDQPNSGYQPAARFGPLTVYRATAE